MPVPSTAAVDAVARFLTDYDTHDLDAMVRRCTLGARFDYVPLTSHDRQRTVSARGSVSGVGKTVWGAQFSAFPDLAVRVSDTFADEDGNVVAEAVLSGTQQRQFATVMPTGRHFTEPHLFRFHVDRDGHIDEIVGYWDAGGLALQLAHFELD